MKKAMLSQPMAGKSEEEIIATREKAIKALKEKGFEIVNTLFTDEWYSKEKMAERGVATNVHYKPLPMMTAYKKMGFDIMNFPNAFAAFDNEITLPLNTKMTMEDLEYVIECLTEILKGE